MDASQFTVEDIFTIEGKGIVLMGKCLNGEIRIGMKGIINGKPTEIIGIESDNTSKPQIAPGETSAIILTNINASDAKSGESYSFA